MQDNIEEPTIKLTTKQEDGLNPSKFRGFAKDVSYIPTNTMKGSICKLCPNLCQLHYIEVPTEGGKTKRLIYGDACDRFQDKGNKFELKEIEDLLDNRLEFLQQAYPIHSQAESLVHLNQGRKIAFPAGLTYWTDFPFWSTFLQSLGLSIIVSTSINPHTVDNADRATNIDSCLPMKMYYELVGDLIDNPEVTDIFIPAMFNLTPLSKKTGKSQICPLITGVSHMVKFHFSSEGVKADDNLSDFDHNKRFLSPELIFDSRYANKKNRILSRKLTYGEDAEQIKQLVAFAGPEFNVSKSMVKNAYITAKKAQKQYITAKRTKGKQVIEELAKKNEHAIVLFGRSYNSFDKSINMKLDFEIRKLGWQVIPFDYLPLEEAELTEAEYNNNNWFFQGNLLAGAEIVKENPLLHGIYITNFKCGSDGFIIKDMERTLSQAGKLMVLEIDDLINATGYKTRIEAYIRSITLANQKAQNSNSMEKEAPVNLINLTLSHSKPVRYTEKDLRKKRVMIPLLSDHSILIAGAFRAAGIDSMHFPPVRDKEMEVGRSLSNGKECLPFTITAGEIIVGFKNEVAKGYDPKDLASIWMITEGPCRFNQYGYAHQFNIDQIEELFGAKMINLVNSRSSAFNGFIPGLKLTVEVIKAYVAGDYMQQIMHQARPYEIHTNEIKDLKIEYLQKINAIDEDMDRFFPPNALDSDIRKLKLADMIYQVYLRKISDTISDKNNFKSTVKEYLYEMKRIPLNKSRKKPLIGMVGEIYLRMNQFSNGDIVRKLEALGAEVHLAPFSELIYYGTHTLDTLGDSLFGSISDKMRYQTVKRVDDSVFALFKDSLSRPNFGQGRDADEIVRYGQQYSGNYCAGEGPLTLGAIEDYARHGADGMIMIGPMGCLPNITFKGLFEKVAEYLPEVMKEMPRMEITVSESLNFKNILTRIEPFVNQAKDYLDNKEE